MNFINIISFNILAPIFASPIFYTGVNSELLDIEARRRIIISFLNSMKDITDIFCLQEVVESEFEHLTNCLKDSFIGYIHYNEPDYWRDWILQPLKYENHGTAIFMKKSVFDYVSFSYFSLTTGNNSTKAFGIHKKTNKLVRVYSVHLDTEKKQQELELEKLLENIVTDSEIIDLIVGDLNCDIIHNVNNILNKNKFKDVFKELNLSSKNELSTIPRHTKCIDHILFYNCTVYDGYIFDLGIMKKDNEASRLSESLKMLGSDHFPIQGTIIL